MSSHNISKYIKLDLAVFFYVFAIAIKYLYTGSTADIMREPERCTGVGTRL